MKCRGGSYEIPHLTVAEERFYPSPVSLGPCVTAVRQQGTIQESRHSSSKCLNWRCRWEFYRPLINTGPEALSNSNRGCGSWCPLAPLQWEACSRGKRCCRRDLGHRWHRICYGKARVMLGGGPCPMLSEAVIIAPLQWCQRSGSHFLPGFLSVSACW